MAELTFLAIHVENASRAAVDGASRPPAGRARPVPDPEPMMFHGTASGCTRWQVGSNGVAARGPRIVGEFWLGTRHVELFESFDLAPVRVVPSNSRCRGC